MARGTRPILARSIRSLARQVHRAESTVRKWIARDDWPFALAPPWEVEKVRAWAEIQLKPDPAAAYRKKAAAAEAGTGEFSRLGPYGKARVQYLIERSLSVRQRRLRDAGKLIDAEEARQHRLRQIHAVKAALLALPRSVANALAGQDRSGIERILAERVRAILQEFAAGERIDDDKTTAADTAKPRARRTRRKAARGRRARHKAR